MKAIRIILIMASMALASFFLSGCVVHTYGSASAATAGESEATEPGSSADEQEGRGVREALPPDSAEDTGGNNPPPPPPPGN